MPVELLKRPVASPEDVRLTEDFVNNSADFGDEQVDYLVYGSIGEADAHVVASNLQPDAEGHISLGGLRDILSQASSALTDEAAQAYMNGVEMFISTNLQRGRQ